MLNRNRPLALLLVCAAGATAAPSAVSAATKAKPATAKAIVKDCAKDGEISRKYRLADLKKARTEAKKAKKTAVCGVAINSAIAGLSGKKGKNSVAAVVKECGGKTGALTKKYKAATLRKALKTLPDDIADYTNCDAAIASQLNTVK